MMCYPGQQKELRRASEEEVRAAGRRQARAILTTAETRSSLVPRPAARAILCQRDLHKRAGEHR